MRRSAAAMSTSLVTPARFCSALNEGFPSAPSATLPLRSATMRNAAAARFACSLSLAALLLVAGCASGPAHQPLRAEDVRAQIVSLLPASVPDRAGWAVDIYAAFAALGIEPSTDHICAVLAVAEQESSYRADPAVPRLGQIAREEIDRRAERKGIPKVLVQAALQLPSPDSRSYSERIDAARTEKELSDIFEDFIASVPLGQHFLAGYNPVRTGGPMQVSIEFAQSQVEARPYPYRMSGSLRDEVFRAAAGSISGSPISSITRRTTAT